MSGHTPGPWRVALGKRYLPQRDERKMEICCIPHSTYDALDIFGPAPNTRPRFDAVRSEPSEAEHLANARLIAAAPCMAKLVSKLAAAGDAAALALMERINGYA